MTIPAWLAPAILATALAAAIAAPAAAQSPGAMGVSAEADGRVAPEARAVLDRMTNYLRGLERFELTSHASFDEVMSYGYKLQRNESSRMLVQRPHGLRAEVSGDLRNRSFVYDGKGFTMYSPEDGVYVRVPAPGTLAGFVGQLVDTGIEMPLLDVLYQAADGSLTENARRGVLVGEATVEGVRCDQLAFRQANVDWQLWVEKGARPLPRKIVVTTLHEVGDPQFQATLSWNLAPAIDARSFAFVPPKGATEIPYAAAAATNDTTSGERQ